MAVTVNRECRTDRSWKEGATMTAFVEDPVSNQDESLTRRALRHALDKTTDMADRELRVPLHYYRDPRSPRSRNRRSYVAFRWRSCRRPRSPTPTITWCDQ